MYFFPNDSSWYQSLASVKPAHRYWYTLAALLIIGIISYCLFNYYTHKQTMYSSQLQSIQTQVDTISVAREHIKQLNVKKDEQQKKIEHFKASSSGKNGVQDIIAIVHNLGMKLEKCSLGQQIPKDCYCKQLVEVTITTTLEKLSPLCMQLAQKGLSISHITLSAINNTQNYRATLSVASYRAKAL